MNKEMFLVVVALAPLHEGGVLHEPEAVGGDASADPVRTQRRGGQGHHRHWRFGIRRKRETLVQERFHAEIENNR